MSSAQRDFSEQIKGWPTSAGIYIMKDPLGRILYVGKAKNLRNRIRSYFQTPDGMSPKTRVLMGKVCELEYTVTPSELDALLLECNLIKKHRPRYNIRLKDDKNFPYVVIDFTHPFPQFRITRRVLPAPNLKYFGPFSGGVNEISRFLLKTFQIRDCSDQKFRNRTRPCLNYEIGTCTAPCVDYVTQEAYGKQIKEAILFLRGKRQILLRDLKKQMKTASDAQKYEEARMLRDRIQAIQHLTEKQGAVLANNQKDIDVIGSYEQDGEITWVVLFLRGGMLTGRRSQKAPLAFETYDDALRSFLEQFYTVSVVPDEIWIAADFPDRLGVEAFLHARCQRQVPIRIRRTEKGMRLLGMARENAKLLHLEGVRKGASMSMELQKELDLPECPHSIEGIDVSNLQGTQPVVSLVHFAAERPLKSNYRLYYPRTVEGQDDFAMIYEACLRRFKDGGDPPPDLLLIDGGKGQLQSACKALEERGVHIPICSLAKARTESAFTIKDVRKSDERIFIPGRKNPIVLREGHPALRLLQQVRDEAHRFAIESHRRRRKKDALETSPLLELHGIGEKSRERLLKAFGSLDKIKEATREELLAAGLDSAKVDTLLLGFQGEE